MPLIQGPYRDIALSHTNSGLPTLCENKSPPIMFFCLCLFFFLFSFLSLKISSASHLYSVVGVDKFLSPSCYLDFQSWFPWYVMYNSNLKYTLSSSNSIWTCCFIIAIEIKTRRGHKEHRGSMLWGIRNRQHWSHIFGCSRSPRIGGVMLRGWS